MAYKKKPPSRSRMLTRQACPKCWLVRPDGDFNCEIEACPQGVVLPIAARRDEWDGRRDPGVKNL